MQPRRKRPAHCDKFKKSDHTPGEMAEWFKVHAWKACLGETLTWVRIPLSPPVALSKSPQSNNILELKPVMGVGRPTKSVHIWQISHCLRAVKAKNPTT